MFVVRPSLKKVMCVSYDDTRLRRKISCNKVSHWEKFWWCT